MRRTLSEIDTCLESESHTIREIVKKHHRAHQLITSNFAAVMGRLTGKTMRKDFVTAAMKECAIKAYRYPEVKHVELVIELQSGQLVLGRSFPGLAHLLLRR